MNTNTRLGLGILLASVVVGILGDELLRATPWGINALLWIAALVAAGVVLAVRERVPLAGGGRWLALPALIFSAGFALRDSPALQASNFLAVTALLSLVALRSRSGRVVVAGLSEYALGLFWTGLHAIGGFLQLLASDIKWNETPRGALSNSLGAITRGLIIALPLLLIFGGLFMAADAVFEGMVTDVFNIDLAEAFSHLFLTVFWMWVVAGVLRLALITKTDVQGVARIQPPNAFRLGAIEIGVVLGLLDVLFLAFVIVQVRYLFGGAALITVRGELTYAEYARRGFFELVTVAALALPLLLGMHWLVRRDDPRSEHIYRLTAGLLVALLFVVMASALFRMRLYQDAYGLTELRLYTTVFMGWLALVLAWFVGTVMIGRRERFAFGALAAACVALAGLNALNPDAFIAQVNAGRSEAVVEFDARYPAYNLSADAVPMLIASLGQMHDEERQIVALAMLERWSPPEHPDWRTWNWGRTQAWAAVAANRDLLEKLAQAP